jgi:hypothetical protein
VFPVRYEYHLHIKVKDIVVTGRCEVFKMPHCQDIRLTGGSKVVSFTYWPRSILHKHLHFCFWYSLFLEIRHILGLSAADKVR